MKTVNRVKAKVRPFAEQFPIPNSPEQIEEMKRQNRGQVHLQFSELEMRAIEVCAGVHCDGDVLEYAKAQLLSMVTCDLEGIGGKLKRDWRGR